MATNYFVGGTYRVAFKHEGGRQRTRTVEVEKGGPQRPEAYLRRAIKKAAGLEGDIEIVSHTNVTKKSRPLVPMPVEPKKVANLRDARAKRTAKAEQVDAAMDRHPAGSKRIVARKAVARPLPKGAGKNPVADDTAASNDLDSAVADLKKAMKADRIELDVMIKKARPSATAPEILVDLDPADWPKLWLTRLPSGDWLGHVFDNRDDEGTRVLVIRPTIERAFRAAYHQHKANQA